MQGFFDCAQDDSITSRGRRKSRPPGSGLFSL
jgi:hypothetical protein